MRPAGFTAASSTNIRLSWIAATLVTALLAGHTSGQPHPRAISEAERAAVELAAQYLASGPSAFQAVLAADSPLRSTSPEASLQEIEVRAGSPRGTRWELQTVVPALQDRTAIFDISHPSGIDEALIMDLTKVDGVYKIRNLRILAEPIPNSKLFDFPGVEQKGPVPADSPKRMAILAGLGLLAIALAVSGAIVRERATEISGALLVAGGCILCGSFVWAASAHPKFAVWKKEPSREKKQTGPVLLADLLPIRRALLAGERNTDLAAAIRKMSGPRRDVLILWKAQHELQLMKLDEAERTLAHFPGRSNIPLTEILRARLGFARGREVDAVLSYERAVNLGPGRDGLWIEAAQSLALLGFEDRAKAYLNRLEQIGSREASIYYELSGLAAIDGKLETAEQLMREAWRMQPAPREDLVVAGVYWELLRREALASTMKFYSAQEPQVTSPAFASRTVTLPPSAQSKVLGDLLAIELGGQSMVVSGGASLAPRGTVVANAADWKRAEEDRSIAFLPQLTQSVRTGGTGVFIQPALRHRIELATSALAKQNRWGEVLTLTEGVTGLDEQVPIEVAILRGLALKRTGRTEDARQLFVRLASGPYVRRTTNPHDLLLVGELLASVKLYQPAIKMMDRASKIREIPHLDDRVRQLLTQVRLSSSYSSVRTAHFEVRHPPDVTRQFAEQLGGVLESEFNRLQSWIPIQDFQPVAVNVVWWDEFRSTFTGGDYIVGFYDGEITVPLAGVPDFFPEITAILTHELTHAMIAQSTKDQSPQWFHEGLAQRVEMVKYHRNAFNMYDRDKLFSISLIDSVLRGSPDPDMIGEGYILSQTLIRYLETLYGKPVINKLIASFREGATTEQALLKATNKTSAQLDDDFWRWGQSALTVFANPEPIRYDMTEEQLVVTGKQGIKKKPDLRSMGFKKRSWE